MDPFGVPAASATNSFSIVTILQETINNLLETRTDILGHLSQNKQRLLNILTNDKEEVFFLQASDFIKPRYKKFIRSFRGELSDGIVTKVLDQINPTILAYAKAHDNDSTSRELLSIFTYFTKRLGYIQGCISAEMMPLMMFGYANRDEFFDNFDAQMEKLEVSDLLEVRDDMKELKRALETIGESAQEQLLKLNGLLATLQQKSVEQTEIDAMVEELKGLTKSEGDAMEIVKERAEDMSEQLNMFGQIHTIFTEIETKFIFICDTLASHLEHSIETRKTVQLLCRQKVDRFKRLIMDNSVGDANASENVKALEDALLKLDFITDHTERDEALSNLLVLKKLVSPIVDGNNSLLSLLADLEEAVMSSTPMSVKKLIALKKALYEDTHLDCVLRNEWIQSELLPLLLSRQSIFMISTGEEEEFFGQSLGAYLNPTSAPTPDLTISSDQQIVVNGLLMKARQEIFLLINEQLEALGLLSIDNNTTLFE